MAVKSDAGASEYASDELKADKEFVVAAVKSNSSALEYALDDLKADNTWK